MSPPSARGMMPDAALIRLAMVVSPTGLHRSASTYRPAALGIKLA
jgi:hypothetical protein